MLKQAIRGSGRLLQWWDKLALPVLNNIGEEKGLALEAKNTLLGILVYDEDDEVVKKDAIHTSEAVSQNLLEVWLKKHQLGDAEFDNEARFVEGQIQLILLAFGRKRPKVCQSHKVESMSLTFASGSLEYGQQILCQERLQNTDPITPVRVHTATASTSTSNAPDAVV